MNNWQDIARVETARSRLERITWPYDKYPDMPQLLAGKEITLLDAQGPGVVTNLHVADYSCLDGVIDTVSANEKDASHRILIEITYDHRDKPDISMPLYAFLADVHNRFGVYSSIYFSRVKTAHNFRLPLPFREHIKIVLKNPTATDFIGYADLQWKQLDALPEDMGYLYVDYRDFTFRAPEDVAVLADIEGAGTVKAQWLCLSSDLPLAVNGEYICEGNQEFYIDGETTPSIEYLGTEDAYGHSWGLGPVSGDGYALLSGVCHPEEGVTEVSMLRCRTEDSISFARSLRLLLDYSQDYVSEYSVNPLLQKGVFGPRKRVHFDISCQSCTYYYGKK